MPSSDRAAHQRSGACESGLSYERFRASVAFLGIGTVSEPAAIENQQPTTTQICTAHTLRTWRRTCCGVQCESYPRYHAGRNERSRMMQSSGYISKYVLGAHSCILSISARRQRCGAEQGPNQTQRAERATTTPCFAKCCESKVGNFAKCVYHTSVVQASTATCVFLPRVATDALLLEYMQSACRRFHCLLRC